jgi:hypothetical protein
MRISAACITVAEESVVGQVPVRELLLLILVGRHALEPAHRRNHSKQQRELRVLGHAGLDEDGGARGVDARGKPVDEHLPDAVGNRFGCVVMGRQRVPVGGEVQALVFFLQPHPVLERAVVVADMHAPRWAHPR